MAKTASAGVYGVPPPELAEAPAGAAQFSPLLPGSQALEDCPAGALDEMVLLAPPGTLERRYALAQALLALKPGGKLTALAPRDKGGARLAKELRAFGCEPAENARRHFRIAECVRPESMEGVEGALQEGGLRFADDIGLWTQPGIFSWDRIDPGSALLVDQLPPLAGRGADFGAGLGFLSRAVLASSKITELHLVDLDRRAVDAAHRNISDARAHFAWADVQTAVFEGLDFVVMNPPFHAGGEEDRSLGQTFIRRAAAALRKGGTCWLTANRHLPYEEVMKPLFKRVTLRIEAGGYKIYEAQR